MGCVRGGDINIDKTILALYTYIIHMIALLVVSVKKQNFNLIIILTIEVPIHSFNCINLINFLF